MDGGRRDASLDSDVNMDTDIYDMGRMSLKRRLKASRKGSTRSGLPPKPAGGAAGHRHTASSHTNGVQTARDARIGSRKTTNRTMSYDAVGPGSPANARLLKLAGQKVEVLHTRLLSKSP